MLFLLTVQPPDQVALGALRDRGEEPTPAQQHGLVFVRGAEVIEVSRVGQHDSWACTLSQPFSQRLVSILPACRMLYYKCILDR